MSEVMPTGLEALFDGVAGVRRLVVEGLVDGPLVVGLRRLADQLDVVLTRAMAVFAEQTSFALLGYPNAGAWMADQAMTWKSEPSQRLKQAALLGELGLFAQVLDEGRVGVAHLKLLTGAVTSDRLGFAVRDEQVLVDAALRCDPAQFAKALKFWVALCDDELDDVSDDDALHRRRSVRLHQLQDGSWHVDGRLDPVAGEAMAAMFDAFMPAPCADDERSWVQRRHDTLHDIVNDVLSRTDRAEVGGERPHVTLIVNADTGVAVTGGGYVLPAFARDMVLCDCVLTKVWVGATGIPFDVGTPQSAVPVRNRRAVVARDRCCRYDRCSRDARWTQLHHLKHREHGGTHELGNLVLMCRFHHRLIHRMALKLSFDTDGVTLMIEWPGGIVIRSPPMHTLLAA